MKSEINQILDLKQVQEIYFQLFPTAKSLMESQASKSLFDLFKPVLAHSVDYKVYPNARQYMELLKREISQTHTLDLAEQTVGQLEESFVINEMVHLSLMRSFDSARPPFIDNMGKSSNEHNYNSLIFQAEALWGSLNHINNHKISFSCNAGMVYIENETSPAYFQKSPSQNDAVKLFTSRQKGAILTYSDLVTPETINQVRGIKNISHPTVASLKDLWLQEFVESNGRSYNQKIALLYSSQLDSIFPQTKHVNVDGVEVFTEAIETALKDKSSVMNYIFANKPVLASMANHFSGVKSGWSNENELGEHTLFFKLNREKDSVVTGRDSFYSYDIEKIINGLENKELLPRTALYFIYNFLEVGLVSLGGTAQAPYLTELKGRMLNFLNEMQENVERGVFPNPPISRDALSLRVAKIKETPTDIPIGGLSVAANKNQQLYSYADYLANEPLPNIDLKKITIEDALNATMPTLITHKCMKSRSFLVGAEEITVPQLSFADNSRYDIIDEFPSKIWTP